MNVQLLLQTLISMVGSVSVLFCVAYTIGSIVIRLDGDSRKDRENLKGFELKFAAMQKQLEALNTENTWLRTELLNARKDADRHRRHPAFALAEEQAMEEMQRRRGEGIRGESVLSDQAQDAFSDIPSEHPEGGDDA